MNKEDVIVIAQLLTSIKEHLEKLEDAYKKRDVERVTLIKREMLALQRQLDKLI